MLSKPYLKEQSFFKELIKVEKILLGLPEAEQKDFYYHVGMGKPMYDYFVEKCEAKVREEKFAEVAKYEAVTINIDLPQLVGSEKQIKWANDIRIKKLSYIAEVLYDKIKNASKETKDSVLAEANLSAISQVFNMAFADWANEEGLLTETSAKKIIETR